MSRTVKTDTGIEVNCSDVIRAVVCPSTNKIIDVLMCHGCPLNYKITDYYIYCLKENLSSEEKRLIDGELLTLTELQGKLSGCPTKHILAKWAQAE